MPYVWNEVTKRGNVKNMPDEGAKFYNRRMVSIGNMNYRYVWDKVNKLSKSTSCWWVMKWEMPNECTIATSVIIFSLSFYLIPYRVTYR